METKTELKSKNWTSSSSRTWIDIITFQRKSHIYKCVFSGNMLLYALLRTFSYFLSQTNIIKFTGLYKNHIRQKAEKSGEKSVQYRTATTCSLWVWKPMRNKPLYYVTYKSKSIFHNLRIPFLTKSCNLLSGWIKSIQKHKTLREDELYQGCTIHWM